MELMYIDRSPKNYTYFPIHRHEVWEITINLQGSGSAVIDGRSYPFKEGTIFCLAPGVEHGKRSDLGFIDGSMMLREFSPFSEEKIYQFEDDASQTARGLFEMIFEVSLKKGANAHAITRSLADALYQMMMGWHLTENRNEVVEQFQKVLLENLSNTDFDISEGIRGTGYSASYFRKLFKQTTGRSPLNYLNQVRIEYAKRQIQQYFGSRSIREIAINAGFADPYYFSRVFSQMCGVSPTRYGQELEATYVRHITEDPLEGERYKTGTLGRF